VDKCKGFHSSTSQPKLRRFGHWNSASTQHIPRKVLTSSREVDESEPLPLVHFSAQPEPLISLRSCHHTTNPAKSAHVKPKSRRVNPLPLVHLSAQPEPFSITETPPSPNKSRKKCSRRAEKWNSVSPWWAVLYVWWMCSARLGAAPCGAALGRPVQVDPIKSKLKAPGIKRLKLKYDELLSNFAFKFNLRRYTLDLAGAGRLDVGAAGLR